MDTIGIQCEHLAAIAPTLLTKASNILLSDPANSPCWCPLDYSVVVCWIYTGLNTFGSHLSCFVCQFHLYTIHTDRPYLLIRLLIRAQGYNELSQEGIPLKGYSTIAQHKSVDVNGNYHHEGVVVPIHLHYAKLGWSIALKGHEETLFSWVLTKK